MNGSGDTLDAIVVGGGPAGLAAAFWLARYRRRVAVLDAGEPRNRATWAVHGYPGLPDLAPRDLIARLRNQAVGAGAIVRAAEVSDLQGERDAFLALTRDGLAVGARRVLLAFGRTDVLPDIPGATELYGTSLFHCPDCDGPSMGGAPVAVIGSDRAAVRLALYLLAWTPRVTLLTDGRPLRLPARSRYALERYEIGLRPEPIERLDRGRSGSAIVRFRGGDRLEPEGIFCHFGSSPAADLAQRLGCESGNGGYVRTDRGTRQTTVPGVFAAGDIAGHPHLAVHAVADGVRAALSIHRSLLPRDFHL